MVTDWKKEIAVAWYVQEQTAMLDQDNCWEYFPPRVGATEADLVLAEATIGHRLDEHYREFLRFANGWQCFYQRVNLFGTEELCGGAQMATACLLLEAIEPEILDKSNFKKSELLPIAASSTDRDLFVIARPESAVAGTVVWLAGYEIEQFPTFDEFFLAIVDYNRIRYERFRSQHANS